MNNDSVGLKGLWQFLGFLLILTIGIMVIYRQELIDTLQSGINPFKTEHFAVLRDNEISTISSFDLRPYHNDLGMVSVDQIALVPHPNGMSQLTFRMTNTGGSNDYPNLKITWTRDGQTTRTQNFSPKDYHPTGRFTAMIVKLSTGPAAGESGVTVETYYGDPT